MKWMRSEECRCGVVVSDEPVGIESYDRPDHVAAYGGYLIAESIPPQFVSLIAASPELLAALEALADVSWTHLTGGYQNLIEDAQDAIRKAKGE